MEFYTSSSISGQYQLSYILCSRGNTTGEYSDNPGPEPDFLSVRTPVTERPSYIAFRFLLRDLVAYFLRQFDKLCHLANIIIHLKHFVQALCCCCFILLNSLLQLSFLLIS